MVNKSIKRESKMSKKPTEEKKPRKPRKPAEGPRRAVIVIDEAGKPRKLSAYCSEKKLSVSTVYLRLKRQLDGCTDDALILQHDDTVLSAARQTSALKVIALKNGVAARVRYDDAIAANADLIISKHGWRVSDTGDWHTFASSLPTDAETPETASDASESESAQEEGSDQAEGLVE